MNATKLRDLLIGRMPIAYTAFSVGLFAAIYLALTGFTLYLDTARDLADFVNHLPLLFTWNVWFSIGCLVSYLPLVKLVADSWAKPGNVDVAGFDHAGKEAKSLMITDALSDNLFGILHLVPLALLYFSWTVLWPLFLPVFLWAWAAAR